MLAILTVQVYQEGSVYVTKVEGQLDPLLAVGLLERAKQEILEKSKATVAPRVDVPILKPKRF